MKRFSLSTLAVAGLLLTACSEKDVIVEGGGTQGEVRPDGYIALNINLPTAPSTRAINDNFDDGDAAEYAVSKYALLIFQEGENEDQKGELKAPLLCVKSFTEWGNNTDIDGDNITTSKAAVATISNHVSGRQLYALAVLNYENVLTIDEDANTVTINNTPSTPVTTLNDLYTAVDHDMTKKNNTETQNYFFMTNALLSTVQGGGTAEETAPKATDVFQLAKLDDTKIYSTEDEALKNPAGEILVERAAAKATVSLINGLTSVNGATNKDNTAKTLYIKSASWTIDNTEPTTYIARNPGHNTTGVTANYYIGYKSAKQGLPYRFVSHTSTMSNTQWGTQANYYRTYWCVDPHYNDNTIPALSTESPGSEETHYLTASTANSFTAMGTSQYCNENTFDVKHQTYRNTTRAIIEVVVSTNQEGEEGVGETFYTLNGASVYYTKSDVETYIKQVILNNPAFLAAIKGGLKTTIETNIAFFDEHFTYDEAYTRDETTGRCTISNLKIKDDDTFFSNTNNYEQSVVSAVTTALATAMNDVNSNLEIIEYTGGKMYYEARFQHFAGDKDAPSSSSYYDLAPWNNGESETEPESGDVNKAYPSLSEPNYLGRYGMVRNNWYDVEVTAFNSLGSPVNPAGKISGNDTPDDNIKDNISVRIHVLAWAKRMQQWKF